MSPDELSKTPLQICGVKPAILQFRLFLPTSFSTFPSQLFRGPFFIKTVTVSVTKKKAILFLMHSHRKAQRRLSFLDPIEDLYGTCGSSIRKPIRLLGCWGSGGELSNRLICPIISLIAVS